MALGSGAMGASARRDGAELDGGSAAAAGARGVETVEDEKVSKFEITAFAVDPDVQARGLGARVLEEIKWVTERGLYGGKLRGRMKDERVLSSVRLESQGKGGEVTGIDVDKLRRLEQEGTGNVLNGSEQHGNVDTDQPELVLTCVRELGTEQYYQRRGFKTVATGTVPAGMWGAKKECTWAYMEAGT
ncbi:hypothetical protein BDZ85DRAFT_263684 [Elsinoe ampelina]|uniref:Uncharacterized protein n=1 Tax=Elsinoe ampelina TaxID=302913 RepID=A0A6A6G9S0_9PEZI|nr:hypothetical protein BDZ85DRAFT_263684 [Elsinoe ampelina]